MPRFFKNTVECINCGNVTNNLDGTGDANGCKCKANYFWNLNTATCDCDYASGWIKDANQCFDCKTVLGTEPFVYFPYNICSCKPGLVWDSTSKTCNCSTSDSNSFAINSVCVNCLAIIAGLRKTSGQNQCDCLRGYAWNSTSLNCSCDPNQNFVIFNSSCRSCQNFNNSNGLANSKG